METLGIILVYWLLAWLPVALIADGAVNVAYADCWGDRRSDRVWWFVASWLRIAAGVSVAAFELWLLT